MEKKKGGEQIDYLMCLIIWKQNIIILNRSVRAFGEKIERSLLKVNQK